MGLACVIIITLHMGVSNNNGTPKSSILIRFSIINHPFWGFSPYFWKHPYKLFSMGLSPWLHCIFGAKITSGKGTRHWFSAISSGGFLTHPITITRSARGPPCRMGVEIFFFGGGGGGPSRPSDTLLWNEQFASENRPCQKEIHLPTIDFQGRTVSFRGSEY